jgi:hypothetical protein
MNRLYQWLSGRASFLHFDAAGQGTSRTVCTQVTVQTESTTLVAGAAATFDLCPFCGQKLTPLQAVRESLRLHEGPISERRKDG